MRKQAVRLLHKAAGAAQKQGFISLTLLMKTVKKP
jgi:hypothetical protein